MKKGITIVMVILCIGLAGIFVWNRVSSDRKAPEIKVGSEKLVYKEGMEDAELLKGVSAKDDKDGDVSDSLVVESIFQSKDGKSVTVVYAAKDENNNVGKAKRTLSCEGAEDAEDNSDNQEADGQEGEEKKDDAEPASTEPNEGEGSEGDGNSEEKPEGEGDQQESDPTAIPADQKAEIDALQPQQPKFYLKEYQTTITVGGSLNKLSFMKDIVDDTDGIDVLSRRIQIEDNLNTQVPGTYEVKYYVVDTQGNQSNVARLTVIVQ